MVSQNCKTKNTPLTLSVIPEQFQTPPGISFRTLLTSSFYVDVILATPITVHTDLNTMIFQGTSKSLPEIGDLINEPFWELVPNMEKLIDKELLSDEKSD